jgi:hypothetical protein
MRRSIGPLFARTFWCRFRNDHVFGFRTLASFRDLKFYFVSVIQSPKFAVVGFDSGVVYKNVLIFCASWDDETESLTATEPFYSSGCR